MNGIVFESSNKLKRKLDFEEEPKTEDEIDDQPSASDLALASLATLREPSKAIQEESAGNVVYEAIRNDASDRSMMILTGFRTVIQKQLKSMPKEYIAGLVYDRKYQRFNLLLVISP